MRVRVAHVSLKFNLGLAQKRADAVKLFRRQRLRRALWITGTETSETASRAILREVGARYGYRLFFARDCWVAVRTKDLVPGAWHQGYVPVIESYEGIGRHADIGICWVSFRHARLGWITVGASHYLTKGARHGQPNYALNTRLCEAIGTWGRERGRGSALVFYGGDQNIPDLHYDTFRGGPFTSLWDELGRHQNTGHGNIDVIASYDRDKRVTGAMVRALNDRQFFLHTDHFLVEGAYKVRPLKKGSKR